MTEEVQHETSVRFMRAWDEWRPECTCGWVGSYWRVEQKANDEADAHLEEA